MFRIECFCDDSKLAKIKWALYELGAYNVTDMPVKDTKPNGDARPAIRQIPLPKLVQEFVAFAKKHKLREFKAQQARDFTGSVGLSISSYSHVLSKLRTTGVVTKIPGAGAFDTSWRFTPSKIKKSLVKEVAAS